MVEGGGALLPLRQPGATNMVKSRRSFVGLSVAAVLVGSILLAAPQSSDSGSAQASG
jgi:hypothetical protein